jgi:hypothetical protein
MNKEEIFQFWAPESATWSRWVKPVLFAHLDSALSHLTDTGSAADATWAPSPTEKVAIIVDLPSADGVVMGVALASRGYRPVPLYNALPMPLGRSLLSPLTGQSVAAVNVLPILAALRSGAEQLAKLSLPMDAPPAFLLDANRLGAGRTMLPGEFDNRSISFTTDFPSANFFAAQGIQRVLLVQRNTETPQSDLTHSLRRWQDAGFVLEQFQIGRSERPERLEVSKPSWYGAMFQRALSSFGFRRASPAGFGAWVPDSSSVG